MVVIRHIYGVKNRDFKKKFQQKLKIVTPKIVDSLDIETMKEYLNQVKCLPNTRHKNTLLRIWNGDCLSYTRQVHMGLAANST
jgi:hypothetical protein